MPLVSVIMPLYNAVAFVAAGIASVQAQTFSDWELIVADDGSTDDSAAIVARLAAADPRIRLLPSLGNQGTGPARNRAIAAATGRYIAFLDADDLWHPGKLATQIGWMQAAGHPLTFTAYTRHNLATDARVMIGVPSRVTRNELLLTNVIGCSTVIYDAAHFGPRAMPALKRRQDFAFWLQLLESTPFAAGLPIALTIYRQHADSVSSSKSAAARSTWQLYSRHLGLSRGRAVWSFLNYSLRGFLRHRAPGLARRLNLLCDAQEPDKPSLPHSRA